MEDTLRCGQIEVRTSDGLVLAGGRPLAVSVHELGLLQALVERQGHIVSREELYRRAWDAPLREGDRSVDVYVHKLRTKLEGAVPGCRYIHTHFGFGYRLAPEPDATDPARSHPFHKSATSA